MEDYSNINSRNVKIVTIRHNNFRVDDRSLVPSEESGGKLNLGFHLEQNHAVNPEKKRMVVMSFITFSDPIDKIVVIEYGSEIVYQLENFDEIVKFTDDDFDVLVSFKKTIYTLTLSTVRGMLFEKLANTRFSKVYIPFVESDYRDKID